MTTNTQEGNEPSLDPVLDLDAEGMRDALSAHIFDLLAYYDYAIETAALEQILEIFKDSIIREEVLEAE